MCLQYMVHCHQTGQQQVLADVQYSGHLSVLAEDVFKVMQLLHCASPS